MADSHYQARIVPGLLLPPVTDGRRIGAVAPGQ